MTDIPAAAEIIAAARRGRIPLAPLAPDIAPRSEAEGYLIQDALHGLLAADFGDRVGYKIGCTSPVMQQYLDIPHPCGGGVFARGVHRSGAVLDAKDFVRVGVECEIAVRLARDLAPSEAPFTAEWVGEAIEAYLPAIEIVTVSAGIVRLPVLRTPRRSSEVWPRRCAVGKPASVTLTR